MRSIPSFKHTAGLRTIFQLLITGTILISFACNSGSSDKQGNSKSQSSNKVLIEPEDLMSYFPDPPQGFEEINSFAAKDSSTGKDISTANLVFSDGKEGRMFIALQDYLLVEEFYRLATGLWNDSLSFERDGSFARPMDLPEGAKGWVSFDQDAKQGTMLIGIKDRYLFSLRTEQLDGTGMAEEWVKSGWIDKLP